MEYFDLDLPSTSQSSNSGSTLAPTDVQDQGTQGGALPPGAAGAVSITSVHTPLDHPNAPTVSTVFHPMLLFDGLAPNFILLTTDGVHFYVHTHHIIAVSMDRMGMLLPSNVVNIMLHIIYGIQCLQYAPNLETTETALEALHLQYGVSIQVHAAPHLPLYQLILSYAPFCPLEAYTVAAHYALEELAIATSNHLLAYDLSEVSDDAARKMGPIYLKRLFILHQSRLAALHDILFRPPREHEPAVGCSGEQRQQLTGDWIMTVEQLVWQASPSTSTDTLRSLLEPIGAAITCAQCAVMLQGRVQGVVNEWSAVKGTI
ncbi:uncharacterized protein BXZ73DRAFT_96607 [Epithele typhae]|uniref:uncharacterized protein n=1 Tax=Epithele typhae TaxID=378194 RepID=UPI002007CC21|nr:uncharacterized protein BXZ73DRAFT_96607 [Epithele typhae]KAH9944110.1 hypothetical protein BXZ73DRAFT_96607 [Epithele typhae]